jgi:radical SAM protein with 4Fe4S-binding SPASM domain
MRLHLSGRCALKLLEEPAVYHMEHDELYALDEEGFRFLKACAEGGGADDPETAFTRYCLEEGILSTEKAERIHPPVERSPVPSLRYLELQITRLCNLRCGHCYLGPASSEELSVEGVEGVLGEFERLQGLRVLITGGEPLMHGDFRRINGLLPRFALRKILFTNGLLLDGEALSGLNVEEIQVSIDGIAEGHDSLRGAGTYRRAMDAVRRALDAGFAVSVSTMVHPGNLHQFDDMDGMFREMGIRDWSVDIPCPEGYLKDHPEFHLLPEEGGAYLRYGFGDGLHGGGGGYACGAHLMSVMADGGCAKCAFYSDHPEGHIPEGLARCWERVRHLRLEDLECDCDMLEACRGGCRFRAELLGSRRGRDFYRCAAYGKIEEQKPEGGIA